MDSRLIKFLSSHDFSERDQRLIKNSLIYAKSDPAGLPGHGLMLIISKLITAIFLLLNFPLESELTRELATRSIDGEVSPELLTLLEMIKASFIDHLKENDAPWIIIKAFDSISAEWVLELLRMIWKYLLKQSSTLVAEGLSE